MAIYHIKCLPASLKNALSLLRRNDPLILASSTAFFATFSIAPILVILMNVLSLYFRSDSIRNKLFERVRTIFGTETARQIETIVQNFNSLTHQWWVTLGGFLFLIFVATTLLRIVKNAIHHLWQIRKEPANKFQYGARERLTSFAMILFMGLLFMATLLIDTSMAFLKDYLQNLLPSVDTVLIRFLHTLFSILAITTWFAILFKILPDAHVAWRVSISGGLLTGILINLGEFILRKLLVYSSVYTIFGASASFAIILLFIFYSSMIVYFGAAFTHAYGVETNRPVRPKVYAMMYEKRKIEMR